ncbi:hypothetical protein JOD55_001019 [Arcanobacterium pluranimalium]|uniref:DUF2017 family protein n=1 Tax=Arcanobacterium pluranimalium TaxID=108028 RepID=UPI0019578A41|nr:DUF2017 family protein [Arcanobacterium pluranimalium]MBM7825192.1 hypothetical protein [Arcanobacterium pluranimalium]
MMAFQIIRGGYLARASEDERQMLGGLARDLVFMLGSDMEHEIEKRSRDLNDDEDIFAAFEDELNGIADMVEAEFAQQDDADSSLFFDDALSRLLPDMSEDPELARELRALTEESVSRLKIDHLTTFYLGISKEPENNDIVVVKNDDAVAWMAALNDIRLVLASRLGIFDEESGDSVYERATLFTTQRETAPEDLPEIETPEDMMTVLYAMISWWQDSLVLSVRNKALRG